LLGLLLIKGLRQIVMTGLTGKLREACEIINKHLPNPRENGKNTIYDCQNLLNEDGLNDFAQV